jgi:hypothetical protein
VDCGSFVDEIWRRAVRGKFASFLQCSRYGVRLPVVRAHTTHTTHPSRMSRQRIDLHQKKYYWISGKRTGVWCDGCRLKFLYQDI